MKPREAVNLRLLNESWDAACRDDKYQVQEKTVGLFGAVSLDKRL